MMMQLEVLVLNMVQREHRERAERHHLLKLARGYQPSQAGKSFWPWTGRRLVALGERLQSGAASAPTLAHFGRRVLTSYAYRRGGHPAAFLLPGPG